jgi:hypothetical protein
MYRGLKGSFARTSIRGIMQIRDLSISSEASSCAPAGMASTGVRWNWDAQLVRQRAILLPYASG